ncbi:MAG TPA: adenosine deaminase [Streptosporangiaceae bacterium]|nr:adenosine deaminase [Streptosporangiaceae bacterium]
MRMLPVAELHIHIEGTLEPELLVRLAARNRIALPATDIAELRAGYRFDSLQSFLDLYYANLRVLRTEQDFYDLARAYLNRAAAAGVRRAEIFFDPQTHLDRGVPMAAVFGGLTAALADGAEEHGVSADLILCFLRDLGADAALQTLRESLAFRDKFIGVGLDSTEVGYPPALFEQVYQLAAAEGLHLVAHAGEEGGPEYVREAVDLLHVERVDHGVRSMEDSELVAELRDKQIALTVCPLSNVALRVVDTLADHMLPRMLDSGLLACVNSDDPAYFGGYMDHILAAVRQAFGFDEGQLAVLARNSFDACFAPEADKRRWKGEVDAWLASADAS